MSGPNSHCRRVSSMGVQSKARYSSGGSHPCLPRGPSCPTALDAGGAAVPPRVDVLAGGPAVAVDPVTSGEGEMGAAPVFGGCLCAAASLAAVLRSTSIRWSVRSSGTSLLVLAPPRRISWA
eukprot:6158751-Heterocapsa_arctica.AAC.1